jgi:proteasome lid subunit RPN8/RPN11
MPVALSDFSCQYDGQTVQVRRGITHVSDDHLILRRYPTRFAPDSVKLGVRNMIRNRSNRSAPIVARRDTRSAIDRPAPKVSRAAADKPTVFIARAAAIAFDMIEFGDGLEQGGGLFGRMVGDVLRIEGITEASPYHPHLRRPNSLRLDSEALDVYAEHFGRNGWRRIGDYHSHPQSARAIPSEGDLRGWSVMAERLNRPYLGAIVVPGHVGEESDDWSRWRMSAWLVEPGASTAVPLSRVTFAAVQA